MLKINNNFIKINNIIRDSFKKIKNHEYLFVNDPYEEVMIKIKKKDRYIVKQTKIINERHLSVLKPFIEYLTL